jgi:hypothetical protein
MIDGWVVEDSKGNGLYGSEGYRRWLFSRLGDWLPPGWPFR